MMKLFSTHLKVALIACVFTTIAAPTLAQEKSNSQKASSKSKGMAVAYPWVFKKGTDTAHSTAITTAEEILRKADYASIPGDVASAAWNKGGYSEPTIDNLPSRATLKAFGKSLKATTVIYGSVSWHTRSIWVNAGPKTISTATVNAYVFDVKTGKVIYKKTKVSGRSDEKSNGLKIAAAILVSPLVTAVSGGPATPQEQRAVQIAMSLAFNSWINPGVSKK